MPIFYESDQLKVLEILENICKILPGIKYDKKTFINLMEYGDSSVNILFIAWTKKKIITK